MSTPAEKFRWTVDRYRHAVDLGFLSPDERFELINGELIAVVPPSPAHARVVRHLNRIFSKALAPEAFIVCVQDPVDLGPDSHPEPDITIALGPESRYENRHPGPTDIVLAVEVADSSLKFDRLVKLPLYSASGIPETWLVDLNKRVVEIHSEPSATDYQKRSVVTEGSISPLHGPRVTISVPSLFLT